MSTPVHGIIHAILSHVSHFSPKISQVSFLLKLLCASLRTLSKLLETPLNVSITIAHNPNTMPDINI